MKKLDNILIIGIGNNTRQDDGLGWCFLDSLLKEGYNEENLLYKYQLMVEDSELIADYDTVFFVDACISELKNGVELALQEQARDKSEIIVKLPPRLSVSALLALATDQKEFAARIRRPLPFKPDPIARRGTAFHSWLEERFLYRI